ncbi:MAG: hypothetical protein PHS49_03420 [Candidatus Gracilibacteria bacterium]|nr:hypothetical protein [Candidatus Gracilibacteria bacterium]
MNYQSLKGMIESIINSYKCPECSTLVNESNIDIIGAAGSTINIDIECYGCGKHSMIKTEVLSLDLTNKGLSKENIEKLKNTLLGLRPNIVTKQTRIKDEEIIDLNRDLQKKSLNVAELLGDNN